MIILYYKKHPREINQILYDKSIYKTWYKPIGIYYQCLFFNNSSSCKMINNRYKMLPVNIIECDIKELRLKILVL